MKLSETFDLVAQVCIKRKLTPIADKVVEVSLDEHWRFWVNGFKESKTYVTGGVTHKIEPFDCHVEFNGWPAGIINPHGGVIITVKEEVDEDTFAEALRKDLRS